MLFPASASSMGLGKVPFGFGLNNKKYKNEIKKIKTTIKYYYIF
jgi:hypothetical protein